MEDVGSVLREWRERRHLTQLDLALQADISTRHLSFLENGKASPSREMIATRAEQLELPLREHNRLLLAAGYAPIFAETPLSEDAMTPVRAAIRRVLEAQEPYPSVVVDRRWNLVDGNRGAALLTSLAAPELLTAPVNVLRVSLHPRGLAPLIRNLREWRAHLLRRLERQIALTADAELRALLAELESYSGGNDRSEPAGSHDLFVPLRIQAGGALLSFVSTVTAFGTPRDITIDELAIESFFPADEATRDALREAGLPGRPASGPGI